MSYKRRLTQCLMQSPDKIQTGEVRDDDAYFLLYRSELPTYIKEILDENDKLLRLDKAEIRICILKENDELNINYAFIRKYPEQRWSHFTRDVLGFRVGAIVFDRDIDTLPIELLHSLRLAFDLCATIILMRGARARIQAFVNEVNTTCYVSDPMQVQVVENICVVL